MDKLALRQQALLEVIKTYYAERGYAPSIRELIDHTDITSTRVVYYNLDILERRGLIRRNRGIARGISLVKQVKGKPKAACSICGQVGEVLAGPSGVTITCSEHGVYFRFAVEGELVAA